MRGITLEPVVVIRRSHSLIPENNDQRIWFASVNAEVGAQVYVKAFLVLSKTHPNQDFCQRQHSLTIRVHEWNATFD